VRKLVAAVCVACVPLLALGSFAEARSASWSANLTSASVIPAVKGSRGSGSFRASLNGYVLTFKLTFSHLSGPAIGANLGFGPKGKAGHLTVSLCAPCKSPVNTGVGLDKSLIKALQQHLLFVVVKTKKYPNGEIRGQIG
jgi:hypothetical protein